MNPLEQAVHLTRRQFFTGTASGLGMLALASLLGQDGLLAADSPAGVADPLAPHAKHCIVIFMEGAPSQLDLFDPKP